MTKYSVWSDATVPGTVYVADPQPINLGARFRSNTDGYIKSIRFYKGQWNNGTHNGYLWTNAGVQLSNILFTEETTDGWQQMEFPRPIAITADTTYVISYHTTSGNYSGDSFGLSSAVTNGPLTMLANGTDGSNGVYDYNSSAVFPTSSYQDSNYWIDVVFDDGIYLDQNFEDYTSGNNAVENFGNNGVVGTPQYVTGLNGSGIAVELDMTADSLFYNLPSGDWSLSVRARPDDNITTGAYRAVTVKTDIGTWIGSARFHRSGNRADIADNAGTLWADTTVDWVAGTEYIWQAAYTSATTTLVWRILNASGTVQYTSGNYDASVGNTLDPPDHFTLNSGSSGTDAGATVTYDDVRIVQNDNFDFGDEAPVSNNLYVGTSAVTAVYAGSTQATAVYVGTNQVL